MTTVDESPALSTYRIHEDTTDGSVSVTAQVESEPFQLSSETYEALSEADQAAVKTCAQVLQTPFEPTKIPITTIGQLSLKAIGDPDWFSVVPKAFSALHEALSTIRDVLAVNLPSDEVAAGEISKAYAKRLESATEWGSNMIEFGKSLHEEIQRRMQAPISSVLRSAADYYRVGPQPNDLPMSLPSPVTIANLCHSDLEGRRLISIKSAQWQMEREMSKITDLTRLSDSDTGDNEKKEQAGVRADLAVSINATALTILAIRERKKDMAIELGLRDEGASFLAEPMQWIKAAEDDISINEYLKRARPSASLTRGEGNPKPHTQEDTGLNLHPWRDDFQVLREAAQGGHLLSEDRIEPQEQTWYKWLVNPQETL